MPSKVFRRVLSVATALLCAGALAPTSVVGSATAASVATSFPSPSVTLRAVTYAPTTMRVYATTQSSVRVTATFDHEPGVRFEADGAPAFLRLRLVPTSCLAGHSTQWCARFDTDFDDDWAPDGVHGLSIHNLSATRTQLMFTKSSDSYNILMHPGVYVALGAQVRVVYPCPGGTCAADDDSFSTGYDRVVMEKTSHLRVAYATRTNLKASSHHVRTGRTVTLSGRAYRLAYNNANQKYVANRHIVVSLYFDPVGPRKTRLIRKVRSNSHGAFRFRVKATKSGTYTVRQALPANYFGGAARTLVRVAT